MDPSDNDLVSEAPIIGAGTDKTGPFVNVGSTTPAWVKQMCRVDWMDESGTPSQVFWITEVVPFSGNIYLDVVPANPVLTGTNADGTPQCVFTVREDRRS
jgi:hypothetical protein